MLKRACAIRASSSAKTASLCACAANGHSSSVVAGADFVAAGGAFRARLVRSLLLRLKMIHKLLLCVIRSQHLLLQRGDARLCAGERRLRLANKMIQCVWTGTEGSRAEGLGVVPERQSGRRSHLELFSMLDSDVCLRFELSLVPLLQRLQSGGRGGGSEHCCRGGRRW